MSKCDELHQIAKDSKEKIQQMQHDCLIKIDETCAALTEKHKAEVGVIKFCFAINYYFQVIHFVPKSNKAEWVRQIQ